MLVKDYLVQLVSTPRHTGATSSEFYIMLPEPTRAGNLIVAGCTMASDQTCTSVTDETANSYSNPQNPVDAGQTDALSGFYCANNAGGARRIKFTFSGQASFLQFFVAEFRNIATASPLDGSSGSGTNGTSAWAPGSLTTTQDGNLVISFIKDTSGAPGFTSIVPDRANLSDAKLLSCDSNESGFSVQAGIQLVHGAINPTITMGGANATDPFLAIGMAFKTSVGAGTAPPAPGPTVAPRIIRAVAYNLAFTGNSFQTIFPCSGSMIHATYSGADGTSNIPIIRSATDSLNNTYTVIDGVPGATTGAGNVNFAYTRGSTPSDQLLISWRLSKTSSPITGTIVVYDVEGADPVVMPVVNAIGTDATGADISMLSITPQVANSLTFIGASVEGGTLTSLVGSSFRHDNATWLGEDATVTTFYENNGWGHVTTTDRSAVTFVWTPTSPTTNWTANAICYAPVRAPVGRQIAPALRR